VIRPSEFSVTTIAPAATSDARYLGNQGDIEVRRAPARPLIATFNLAGFKPGGFLIGLTDNRGPIVGNVGLTRRF
jgi:hypothetical protein